ncbi:MAG: hypothetical protein E7003_06810 [Eggerthellaceae bacterium]|nr:hypothetical protein [Eggerthellaceae bacterium]
MQSKYSPGQTVYLSGANKGLIEEAMVLKYASGFYTIRYTKRKGGTRVRIRLYPTMADAEPRFQDTESPSSQTNQALTIESLPSWLACGIYVQLGRRTFFKNALTYLSRKHEKFSRQIYVLPKILPKSIYKG